MSKKLLLALDGGGTKGAMELRLISYLNSCLENKFKSKAFMEYNKALPVEKQYLFKSLMDEIDVVGGVSVGAINAAGISLRDDKGNFKLTPDQLIDRMLKANGNLFEEKSFIAGIFGPSMTMNGFKKMIDDSIGGVKFQVFDKEIEKPELLMTSLNLDAGHHTVWTNIGTTEQRVAQEFCVDDIENIKMTDAALASASAPTFLAAQTVNYSRDGKQGNYLEIDGGVVCNSPIFDMVTLVNALERVPFSDMYVLSISCGTISSNLSSLANKGLFRYTENLNNMLSQLILTRSDREKILTKTLVEANGGKCHVINPKLTPEQYSGGFDDTPAAIQKHIKTADDFIKSDVGQKQLTEVCNSLFDFICSKHELDCTSSQLWH